ncbi:MFS transporter [Meiothermus rufus]|uniref:MFS transporter n=1 Tax=Meiothermus rufus TaxID=604332 RepID=UPI00040EC256|nr:MFS transporter [Meiothermus rufus]
MTAEPTSTVPIPPLVRQNTWRLSITQAINGAGIQLIPTFGAIQVVMLLGNATFAGLATSLMALARVVTASWVGRLSDQKGRKAGLFLGLWLGLVGAMLVGTATLMGSFVLFCAGILVFGSGVGAVQQMRVAAADMYPPSRRGEGLSLVALGSLFGAVLSPLLVAFAEALSQLWHLNEIALAWLLVPGLILPGFLLVYGIRPDPRQMALEPQRYYPTWALQPTAMASGSLETPHPPGPRLAAILSAVVAQGQMVMMMAMTPLALKALECSLSQISFSVALHVVGMFAFSWFIGRMADRIGRKPILLAGLGVAGLGALLVGLGSGYWPITIGTFLVGLGWSGAFLGANTMLTDVTPAARRGRAIGSLDQWANLAGMGLPILGGLVVEALGLRALGFLGALLMLLPIASLTRVQEHRPGSYTAP